MGKRAHKQQQQQSLVPHAHPHAGACLPVLQRIARACVHAAWHPSAGCHQKLAEPAGDKHVLGAAAGQQQQQQRLQVLLVDLLDGRLASAELQRAQPWRVARVLAAAAGGGTVLPPGSSVRGLAARGARRHTAGFCS